MSDTEDQKTPRSRRRKGGLIAMLALIVVLIAAGVGAVLMVGRPVDAPPWLRDKIEERIAQTVPGIDIDFGKMSLLVQRSGLARVILWDVSIQNKQGGQIAALSDIEAGLSPAALLRGQLVLKEAQVSGAFVTLQRDEQGRLGLALGDAFAENTDMPDVTEILHQIDQAMLDPRLVELNLFEADALTLRFEDKRARKGWTADGGRIRLLRKDGELQLSGDVALLGGGDGVATISLNADSAIGDTSLNFGVSFDDLGSRDIATQSPALAWLEELDAPISGALRSRMRQDGTLGLLNATLQIGKGVLQPNRATKAVPFDGARTYFTYDPETALLSFDEISVASSLGQIAAEGTAQLQGLDLGWPKALIGQFRLSDIKLAKGTLFERALDVSGAEMAFKMQLNPFQVSLGNIRVTDPDFPLRARGELIARSNGWAISLDAMAKTAQPDQILSFWPASFKPKPRKWVADNVRAGVLSDATFALRAEPGEKPETYLDFRFAQGEVTVNRALPPLKQGVGRMSMYDNRLSLRLEAGQMTPKQGGVIDLAGSEFVISDMKQKPATGQLRLAGQSSVEAGLSLLDNERWQVMRKVNRPVDLASGQVTFEGRVELPLVKGTKLPDVKMLLNGQVRDVSTAKLVPGHTLAAESLELSVSNDQVSLEGAVLLSGVPAQGRWQQSLTGGPGEVVADVTISPKTMGILGVALPDGMISGKGIGQFSLTLVKGQVPEFSLTSNLNGIGLAIPPLGWRLSQNSTGRFELSGTFAKPMTIDRLDLKAGGLNASGSIVLTPEGGFRQMSLASLTIGSWLDAAGVMKSRGPGKVPAIEVTSGSVDLREATFGAGAGGGGGGGGSASEGGPMAVTLERLRVTDTITMQNFRGNFDMSRGLEGRFDASLGKRADIQGRVIPQNGRSAFRITGEDAGDILRDTGYLKTVSDGTFRLDLAPVKGTTGSYDGQLNIEGTRLRDAPAIGALLDAISIVGLLDQLNGPGIFFTNVEADFRLTPDNVVLKQASAVGPSMGISMDGFYDLGSGRMDMQGVLSPIYFVNGIGRIIARKGEGLIGFNFNLNGSVDNLRVAVNPLSVLTPGMFRDIFRRPPPKVSQ